MKLSDSYYVANQSYVVLKLKNWVCRWRVFANPVTYILQGLCRFINPCRYTLASMEWCDRVATITSYIQNVIKIMISNTHYPSILYIHIKNFRHQYTSSIKNFTSRYIIYQKLYINTHHLSKSLHQYTSSIKNFTSIHIIYQKLCINTHYPSKILT